MPGHRGKYNRLPHDKFYAIRALVQVSGWKVARIQKEKANLISGISLNNLYVKKALVNRIKNKNAGRPQSMTPQDERRFCQEISHLHKLEANFSSIDLQDSLNMSKQMSNINF